MTQYKWKLVKIHKKGQFPSKDLENIGVSGDDRSNNRLDPDDSIIMTNIGGRAYRTLRALLKYNCLSKDDVERDIDYVKSHHGIVVNNTGIGGKWECRYYTIKPRSFLSESLEIWKSY